MHELRDSGTPWAASSVRLRSHQKTDREKIKSKPLLAVAMVITGFCLKNLKTIFTIFILFLLFLSKELEDIFTVFCSKAKGFLVCVCVCVLRCVLVFVILWTIACQAALSMKFSRQESLGCCKFLAFHNSQLQKVGDIGLLNISK